MSDERVHRQSRVPGGPDHLGTVRPGRRAGGASASSAVADPVGGRARRLGRGGAGDRPGAGGGPRDRVGRRRRRRSAGAQGPGPDQRPSASTAPLHRAARPRRAADALRAGRVPARPARGRGRGARRPRQPGGDADRRRQEPLLPAAGDRLRRPHGRGLAADRADGRPVPTPAAGWPPGGDDRLGDGRRCGGGGAGRRARGPRPDRVVLARALRVLGVPGGAGASGRSVCSPSTRPTACRSGATTSGPTTCGCAG